MRSARSPGGRCHGPAAGFPRAGRTRTLLPSGERVLNRKQRQEGRQAAGVFGDSPRIFWAPSGGPRTPLLAPPPLGLVRPAASAAQLSPGLQVSVWAPPHPSPGPWLGLRALTVCLSFTLRLPALAAARTRPVPAWPGAQCGPSLALGAGCASGRHVPQRAREVEQAEERPLTPCGRDRAMGRSGWEPVSRALAEQFGVGRSPASFSLYVALNLSLTLREELPWENRRRDPVATSFPPHKAGRSDCALKTRPGA